MLWLGGSKLSILVAQKEDDSDYTTPMILLDDGLLLTTIYQLEEFLLGRLNALQTRIAEKVDGQESIAEGASRVLELIDGCRMLGVRQQYQFYPPREILPPSGYQALGVFPQSKDKQHPPIPDRTARQTPAIGLGHEAILQKSDTAALQFHKFNVLIAAGGANDFVRNLYLGVPEPQSLALYYNVVTLEKGRNLRKYVAVGLSIR